MLVIALTTGPAPLPYMGTPLRTARSAMSHFEPHPPLLEPATRRVHRRSFRWIGVFLGLAALALVFAITTPTHLTVDTPLAGERIGAAGITLLVRFDASGRTASATFRATLNGADVTDQLTVAENGVHGTLHGLLEGENVLRLEVFGSGPWPGRWLVEQTRELRVRFRPPLDWSRG